VDALEGRSSILSISAVEQDRSTATCLKLVQ
jgi:hypothetical protein